MWRSVFLATGIGLCILGAECLVMDKVVLAKEEQTPLAPVAFLESTPLSASREIRPPEWAPWTLLSSGAVVILYSYSIPRRTP